MFRIKIGEHITLGDISRGPKMVIECDHVNELVDLIRSKVLREVIVLTDHESEETKREQFRKDAARQYGLDE